MIVKGENIMISLGAKRQVMKILGRPGRKRWMKMRPYGLATAAKDHSELIDADDSDELRSVWSRSDEEKTLWTGSEGDDDDDIPTEPYPNEASVSKKARKLAVENALKKLRKGPDGRYTNVWEVMSDIDILIGAFENIVSGPAYEELRKGGPKKLNVEFFKDIQARMRDPNYKLS
ncbi:Detected protein of confused Function [Hibiscus syriacus]|uniref:Detected protein of confused Function n=1 Tax=Hibiscus syriacus TaxID=106335 RepID=A0A6A2X2Y7_HIBSY|nr:Detected protein of confused Function [Hibiscus syriacus]